MRRNWFWSLIFFVVALKFVTHVILNITGALFVLVGHITSAVIVIALLAYFFGGARHHRRYRRRRRDNYDDNYEAYNDYGEYGSNDNNDMNYNSYDGSKNYDYKETSPEKMGKENKKNKNYNEDFYDDEYSVKSKDVFFSSRNIVPNVHAKEYNVVFGNGSIDFTRLPVPNKVKKFKVDYVFSGGEIKINPNIPLVIKVDSVFSSAELPNIGKVSFGEEVYFSPSYRKGEPHFYIKLDTVFSSVVIREVV
ncbi:hypothetical protein IAI10_11140 [Clostridium sp. 19966]|uniref:hypothetical protein n=1 Tax=Clostridium sp. 19966 TaxID=2768166 RepID=UPI0028DD83BC|nr:hypothetical protein [Clostridium sp. 19966]MDT8717212.1 hypothetical protein [Clostridium sp. 19966]